MQIFLHKSYNFAKQFGENQARTHSAMLSLWLLFLGVCGLATGLIVEEPMPQEMCECFSRYTWEQTKGMSDIIRYKCINFYLSRTYKQRWYKNITESTANFIESLEREAMQTINKARYRSKRQAPAQLSHGRRKELRMLTRDEYRRFVNAVNALKRDTTDFPNVYEALANIHNDGAFYGAHFGPSFCPWHRYYLFLFEQMLKRKDPTVTLPYIDTSMDTAMLDLGIDPINSDLWSPDLLGGRTSGRVIDGPFAYWRYQAADGQYVPLIRNLGSSRTLFPIDCIRLILQETRSVYIFEPRGKPDRILEQCHNIVHSYISGTMDDATVSPNDPAFFLHHCFIDYAWEEFRENAKNIIGPLYEYDYPIANRATYPEQWPWERMANLREFQNINGMMSLFTDSIYKYDPSPSKNPCTTSCNSEYLRCVNGRCVATTRHADRSPRKKRSTDTEDYQKAKTITTLDESYQNSYVINGVADINLWAFIQVRIMYRRPRGQNFNCKPIVNGEVDTSTDIYAAKNASAAWNYFQPEETSFQTSDSGSGATKIFIQSDGLSYKGRNIDYAIVDTRQIMYETVAYVAVKHPRDGAVTAYISAHDLHGYVCQPRCIDSSSNTLYYKKCSGVVRVTTEEPKMYGDTIGDAVLLRYTYADDDDGPRSRYRDQFLTFMCDYKEEYPWSDCAGK